MSSRRLTRDFVLLRALRWLPVGVVLPFLVIVPDSRGLSLAAIGVVFAVHSAVAVALELPSGALADVIGRRRVLLAGAAITAISLAAFAAASDLAAFCGSLALLAAGRALISGSLEAWYVDALRLLDPVAPLARGLSRGTAAEGVAMAVGALAGGVIVALWGYTEAVLAGALAATVYLIAVAVLVREPRRDGPRASGAIRRRTREVLVTARSELAGSAAVQVVFGVGIAFGVSISAVELLWQPRLAGLVASGQAHGLAFGALVAGSMLAVAVGAGLSPAINRRLGLARAYVGAVLASGLLIVLLGAPETPLAFAALYLLAYLVFGASEPMHLELLNDAVGPTARATLISGESLATQSGALVANLGIGALAAAHGTGLAWAIAGAVLALSGVGAAVRLYVSARRLRRSSSASVGSSNSNEPASISPARS
jgi:Major Facilitator Superfamily